MAQQATAPAEIQETEITLGIGKLLGIFLALVIVCGIFFALGYNLGRASVPSSDPNVVAAAPATIAAGGSKRSAVVTSAPAPADSSTAAPTNAASAGPTAPTQPPAQPAADSKPSASPAQPAQSGTVMVQVAAVTHQEDADALIAALRQKNYSPVIVSNLPDKLFHVQIGPFADRKDASAMRERLLADGFNSILK
jgi:DedD protein